MKTTNNVEYVREFFKEEYSHTNFKHQTELIHIIVEDLNNQLDYYTIWGMMKKPNFSYTPRVINILNQRYQNIDYNKIFKH